MQRLQRVLASSVLRALRAREHVVISAASADAITDEMEAVIAPALDDITPHLSEVGAAMSSIDTGRFTRAELHLDGSVTTAESESSRADEVGDEESASDPKVTHLRGKALRLMVDRITERLLESDHVDDIHADDEVIRRDAFRAIRKILLRYIHGDLEVEDDVPDEETSFMVVLERLGYVVSSVAERLDAAMLEEAIERAAASSEAELLWLDTRSYVAAFDSPGGPEVSRLTLEEAITEELVGLVDAELVELPCIEQVLELDDVTCAAPGFADAVDRAQARIRAETGSMASCAKVNDRTVVATFTPLSDDAAARADEHFASFLTTLEGELSDLSRRGGRADDDAPASSKKVPSRQRRRRTPAAKGAASKKKRASKKAPASRPRGKATAAPEGRSSQTRSRDGDDAKSIKRRPTAGKKKRRNG